MAGTDATTERLRVRCPDWCERSPCATGEYARQPGDVLHSAGEVHHAVPDGSGRPGRHPAAFYFELACFSRSAEEPGAPFIIFDEDCNTELRDVGHLDALIDDLEEALIKLREWRRVMADYYGEPPG
jgi:hypothetical protein